MPWLQTEIAYQQPTPVFPYSITIIMWTRKTTAVLLRTGQMSKRALKLSSLNIFLQLLAITSNKFITYQPNKMKLSEDPFLSV